MEQSPSSYHPAVTAIVIAGGQGQRMNSLDKALLQWRGRTFIEHIIANLSQQVSGIAINSNANSTALHALGLPLLPDPFVDRRGPLAGVLAGLNFSKTALTLFVPCDNPLLPDDLLTQLLTALTANNADIAYASCTGDGHYLYALMRTDLRTNLERFLQNGDFAVRHWYAAVNAVSVDFSAEADRFININTPDDLALLPQ